MIRVRLEKWRKIKSKNFGFFEDQELVAVMDLVDGYPKADIAYIGFFMMSLKRQGKQTGTASAMITFAEKYCKERYALHKYELLTGKKNTVAQSVYDKLGYKDDHEIHMSKRV